MNEPGHVHRAASSSTSFLLRHADDDDASDDAWSTRFRDSRNFCELEILKTEYLPHALKSTLMIIQSFIDFIARYTRTRCLRFVNHAINLILGNENFTALLLNVPAN